MHATVHTAAAITDLLEHWLEADLSHHRVDLLANELAALEADDADFILSWIKRIAAVHLELGWQFGKRAPRLLVRMGRRQMESWALFACDVYDRSGLRAALQTVEKVEEFATRQREMTAGVLFEDVAGVLTNFVRGFSGRRLNLVQGEILHTDTANLVLPAVIARLPRTEDNFQLAKAAVALLWAQTRYGTFQADLVAACAPYPDPARALRQLHGLETLRLTARLARELPGLHREMERLKAATEDGLRLLRNLALRRIQSAHSLATARWVSLLRSWISNSLP